jgi:DNA modification methylase
MATLEFGYRSVSDLTPYVRNARTHSKKQINQIAASITGSVFANPILVDEACEIIAGHGRLLAAKQLGLKEVPIVKIEGLTDGQKRALRLADNKIASNAGWDRELLIEELAALEVEGIELLELTGFEIGEIDALRAPIDDPADDTIPSPPVQPVSQTGDIWMLGDHRVACGDVRDQDLMATLAPTPVDAGFHDPPYNDKVQGHVGGKGKTKHREFMYASGEMSPREFVAFLEATLGACAAMTRPGGIHFVCMDHHHAGELITAGDRVYGKRLNICIWKKSNAGLGSLYRSQHEMVFVYRVGDEPHTNNVELGKHGRNRTNVWDYASVNTFGGRSADLQLHPTVKSVAMVSDAIMDVTRPGGIVLDGFLGSGTTLIAAHRTGRICRGVDVDPIYVDVAITRFRDLFGVEPVLEETGETFSDVDARRSGGRAQDIGVTLSGAQNGEDY